MGVSNVRLTGLAHGCECKYNQAAVEGDVVNVECDLK